MGDEGWEMGDGGWGMGDVRGLEDGVGVERSWGGREKKGDCGSRARRCCGYGFACQAHEVRNAGERFREVGWCGGFGSQDEEAMIENRRGGGLVVMLDIPVFVVLIMRMRMRIGIGLVGLVLLLLV